VQERLIFISLSCFFARNSSSFVGGDKNDYIWCNSTGNCHYRSSINNSGYNWWELYTHQIYHTASISAGIDLDIYQNITKNLKQLNNL
jgi:hypothetical protein